MKRVLLLGIMVGALAGCYVDARPRYHVAPYDPRYHEHVCVKPIDPPPVIMVPADSK